MMKHSYWVSYQFKLPDGSNGFGDMDIVTDAPLAPTHIPDVRSLIANRIGNASASVVIIAISKFEGQP